MIEERFDFPMSLRPMNLSVQNQRLGADGRRTRLSLTPVIREIIDAVKTRMENEKLKISEEREQIESEVRRIRELNL